MFATKNKNFNRSHNYRNTFLNNNKGYKKDGIHYHCAYCGKKIHKNQMQVDHLFSVYNARTKLSTRMKMRALGINDVNGINNLVPACQRCNLKKGKMGHGWIWRGYLGKSIWFHRVKKIIIILIILGVIYLVKRSGYLS